MKILIVTIILLISVNLSLAEENIKIPAPGRSILLKKTNEANMVASKGATFIFLSKLDQNAIENQYKEFFRREGFRYRQDKDIRKGKARRLRFDKDNLVIDITMMNMRKKGTMVNIMRYLASDAVVEPKDLATIDKTKIELPDYSKDSSFKVEPFKAATDGNIVYTGGVDLDIAPPPDSELIPGPVPVELTGSNGQGVMYKSKASAKKIESFYQSFFKKNGFKERTNRNLRIANVRRVRFERKDLAAEVYINSIDNTCNVTVIKYLGPDNAPPAEKNPFYKTSRPKQDNVGGKDLEDVPRPDNSVRTAGRTIKNKTFVSYLTPAQAPWLRSFYLKEMRSSGWNIVEQFDISKVSSDYAKKHRNVGLIRSVPVADAFNIGDIVRNSFVLDFKNSAATARIMIYPDFTSKESGTIVDIVYTKN